MTIRCLTDFLGDYPLYKEYEAITGYQRGPEGYTHPFDLDGQTFNYLCPKENQLKVFVLNSTMEYIDFWKDTIWEESISPSLLDVDGKLNFIHYYEGKCTSCKEMHAGFLLHIYSKEPIPKEKVSFAFSSPESDPFYNKEINIYIEKVGEYPKKEILVTKDFVKYFDRESRNWYFKAKKSYGENMGIGAFAYYRRIVEKEMIHFMTDIASFDTPNSEELKKLINEFKVSGKVYLLYENTYKYLPPSLQALGDNPLKLLYQQTSKGLHNLTEDECLKTSEIVDSLLEFVVRKINEEMHEIKEIKKILNKLK